MDYSTMSKYLYQVSIGCIAISDQPNMHQFRKYAWIILYHSGKRTDVHRRQASAIRVHITLVQRVLEQMEFEQKSMEIDVATPPSEFSLTHGKAEQNEGTWCL